MREKPIALNRVNLSDPVTDLSNSNFGNVTSQLNTRRSSSALGCDSELRRDFDQVTQCGRR